MAIGKALFRQFSGARTGFFPLLPGVGSDCSILCGRCAGDQKKKGGGHEAGLRKNRVIIALAGIFAYAFIVEFLG